MFSFRTKSWECSVAYVNHHLVNFALRVASCSGRFISVGKYTNSGTGWTRKRQAVLGVTEHWGAFTLPLLQWKSSKYYIFWVYVCSLSYPACKTRVSYYIVICGLPRSTIFCPHFLKKRHDFGREKLLSIKYVFWFDLQLLPQKSVFLRRTPRDIVNVHRSSRTAPVILATNEAKSRLSQFCDKRINTHSNKFSYCLRY